MISIRNLPFPKVFYRGVQYVLPDDLVVVDGRRTHKVPTGTEVTLLTSRNFGHVVIPEPSSWGQRIFRF